MSHPLLGQRCDRVRKGSNSRDGIKRCPESALDESPSGELPELGSVRGVPVSSLSLQTLSEFELNLDSLLTGESYALASGFISFRVAKSWSPLIRDNIKSFSKFCICDLVAFKNQKELSIKLLGDSSLNVILSARQLNTWYSLVAYHAPSPVGVAGQMILSKIIR
ncbi:hypothetical protein OUZ56_032806 [Daphnia magna]|uniref:Uncharacterized protein n=1 Tax=Daphnia magna TaxID=35525 RepID=A0ABR0B9L5_9CRUS|nr:hypothetical protein OUZ56_032806 [Daphnia magna]